MGAFTEFGRKVNNVYNGLAGGSIGKKTLWQHVGGRALVGAGYGAAAGALYGAVDADTSVLGGAFRGALAGGIGMGGASAIYRGGVRGNLAANTQAWGNSARFDKFL